MSYSGKKYFLYGMKGVDGEWLPVYFEWDQGRWAPVLPVYIHALTSSILGKSILVARGTSAALGIIALLAVSFTLKRIFHLRFWWAGGLLLITIPAWFLYSRTTFETVAGTSLLALSLYCYLLYRCIDPKYLYPTVLASAAAVYAYSNLQLVIVLLAVLLLATDFRYHVQQKRTVMIALLLIMLASYPFIRFRIDHPTAIEDHLRAIASYWVESQPLSMKLSLYSANYLRGLSPMYWFLPKNGEEQILPNFHFKGHGHLGFVLIPFLLLGLILVIRQLSDPRHRLLLASLLVIPAGASVDSIEIPRVLGMVIPASLIATLGLDWLLCKFGQRKQTLLSVTVFLLLCWWSLLQLKTALQEGPRWHSDFGLFGMQFGVRDLYEEVLPNFLREDPDRRIILNTTWLINAHLFPRFFLSLEELNRIGFGNVRDYLKVKQDIQGGRVILMSAIEYEAARDHPLLEPIKLLHTINNPLGEPALYLGEIRYSANADEIFSQMREDRRALVIDELEINSQVVRIEHSILDVGSMSDLLDGNFDTLVRGESANPILFKIHLQEITSLYEIAITVGSMSDFTVTLHLYPPDSDNPHTVTQRFQNMPSDPTLTFPIEQAPISVVHIDLEIIKNDSGAEAKIHIRDLRWR